MTAYPKNGEYIRAWQRMGKFPSPWFYKTNSQHTELYVLTQGKKKFYFMAYGSGYNCEDGVFIDILSQEEFDNKFSLVQLP